MTQYSQIKDHYQTLKGQIADLQTFLQTLSGNFQPAAASDGEESSISPLDEIFTALNSSISELDRLIFDEYIDFQEICDNLPDAIYVSDKKGDTIYVNDMYLTMSGIPREEVIGENVHQINKDERIYTNGIIPRILENPVRQEQIGFMNLTNTTVYLTGFPIFDENHELKYAVAHDRDIQQLETIKDQLMKLKDSMDKTENEAIYLRKQQLQSDELIYNSSKMLYAVSTAMSVAPTDATVLITGESGTGKEVFANEIYKASKRSEQPFIKVNCGAIPESLIESELFGYVPGAFTGASKKGKTGIFEMANHGTLMLDEIGEMSLLMQTRLLRVLQNHEIRKVGANRPIPVDIRIIAATNKDLKQGIEDKTFREDLFYRLNVVPITIAPLRERTEDISILSQHFLEKYNSKYHKHVEIYSDAMHLMESYDWPGNVRELENVIERLVIITEGSSINIKAVSMILGITPSSESDRGADAYNLKAATRSVECTLIKKALSDFSSGRKAAAALGIDHSTLIKKCRNYGISQ